MPPAILAPLAQIAGSGGSLVQLIVLLVVVGVLLWVVEAVLPIDPAIRRIIHVVVILAALLMVLRWFGII